MAEAVTSGTPSTTTLTYLVTNAQGTPLEALDGSGAVTVNRLYTPYGASRYTSGAFPTSYGYTGQRTDATSGLDYYGARYYDPAIAQFTSADTLLTGGLNRYGYVGGNPVTRTDPHGHMAEEFAEKGGGSSVGEGGESNENLQSSLGGGDRTDGTDGSTNSGGNGGEGTEGSTTGNASSPVMAVYDEDTNTYTYFVPEVTEADLEADLQSVEQSQEFMRDAEQQQQQQQQQPNVNTPHTPENPDQPQTPSTPESPGETNQLPNPGQAKVDPNKFENYSMDPTNPNSNEKPTAFRQVGYDVDTPQGRASGAQDVMQQLRDGLANSPAQALGDAKGYGERWITQTPITEPSGGQGTLVGVWQIEDGIPRLITNWLETWK